MVISQTELKPLLLRFNPWWQGQRISLPKWHRKVLQELFSWANGSATHRALFLQGARGVGKTTLLLQMIQMMIDWKLAPDYLIFYVSMDHPLLKLTELDFILQTCKALEPFSYIPKFIFIDEIQYVKDWEMWVKQKVYFDKEIRIIFTSSVNQISNLADESGVDSWDTFHITTLSFYEYIKIKNINLVNLPSFISLYNCFSLPPHIFSQLSNSFENYRGYFNEYLVRGGFPQTAMIDDIFEVQRLIREDIIDKILKLKMTTFYDVRHIKCLENIFLYICMHAGSIIKMKEICENLEITRYIVQECIEILEASYLVYRVKQFGYGNDKLCGREKIYLSDASIEPAIFLKGSSMLHDKKFLEQYITSTILKHIVNIKYFKNVSFNALKDSNKYDGYFIVTSGEKHIPIVVKYGSQSTEKSDFGGMLDFMKKNDMDHGYIITENSYDFGIVPWGKIMKIPAHIFCYHMGENELLDCDVL